MTSYTSLSKSLAGLTLLPNPSPPRVQDYTSFVTLNHSFLVLNSLILVPQSELISSLFYSLYKRRFFNHLIRPEAIMSENTENSS